MALGIDEGDVVAAPARDVAIDEIDGGIVGAGRLRPAFMTRSLRLTPCLAPATCFGRR